MIEILPESANNVLVARASGYLTADDYEKIFLPALNEKIEKFGKVRAALHLDEQFVGWELGAMWEDAKFGLQHRNDFDRVAVIGGPAWMEWASKIGGYFIDGEIRTFEPGKLQSAIEWVQE